MRRLLLPITCALVSLLLFLWPTARAGEPPPPTPTVSPEVGVTRLHPALRRALAGADEADTLPIIVEWRRDMQPVFQAAARTADLLSRRRHVVAALKQSTEGQAALLRQEIQRATAEGLATNVRTFWASPIIALDAKPALIDALSRRDDVVQVRLDEQIRLDDDATISTRHGRVYGETPALVTAGLPWNLSMLDVELAESALGLDGSGVVVATLDSGVDWQHPALRTRYRGYNPKGPAVHAGNWYVATSEEYVYPGDGNGHGTHVMGTILGDDGEGNRIGVAPGATWIAVKLFTNDGITYESWIHDAVQWILAPDGDPALAPDVVNNSWGAQDGSNDRFRPDVQALRAAGILPVFAAGNEGPGARTTTSPASYPESLAVGAVDAEQEIATFSSRGPSPWDEVKPEMVAPGVNVRSAVPGGGYALKDGTSMAAPHVAGLAALLLDADPTLTPDEIEEILTTTAKPLDAPTPNNDSGWGLAQAYAAGLAATANGELTGDVVRQDGGGIANPSIAITTRDGSDTVTIGGDATGHFTAALTPGRYDVTARAFGFEPATQYAVEVVADEQSSLRFTLREQALGVIFGRVTDETTGAPLSATLSVEGAPVEARTDANTGAYGLALPAGTWPIRIVAERHRVGHITPTVTAKSATEADVTLAPAPHILLVDSGRWYYDSQITYFEDTLDALDYPYRVHAIRNPFGEQDDLTQDRPTTDTLSPYDVVIWSAPLDSPGLIDAETAVAAYLNGGGRLLLSGQDVAYWDAGGNIFSGPTHYFRQQLGAWFVDEGNLGSLDGEGPLENLTLELNTSDSAGQQRHPDEVVVREPLLTAPAARWDDGSIGGITAGTCRPYRAAWLGAGLEGVGPRQTRIATMNRLLEWLTAAPEQYGLSVSDEPLPLIGRSGTTVSQTIRLDSTGIATDTVELTVSEGAWPLDLELPDGRHVTPPSSTTLTLDGCTDATLTATVTIPPEQPRNTQATYRFDFRSVNDQSVTTHTTLRAKTPASVLLVDDERFYDHQDQYTSTLNALGIPYDLFTSHGDTTPSTTTLTAYPLVIWTTGYDWFSPLRERDERRLSAYLDQGGRLLISSQDLLDVRGESAFVRERLGAAGATLSVTPTEVLALPESPLNASFGPWSLSYPFRNWSDGMRPARGATGTLRDGQGHTVGVVRPSDAWRLADGARRRTAWRTAFFSFPLETLDDEARRGLMSRTLVWLSLLGESRLQAPLAAAEGSRIPLTLTLGVAGTETGSGLRAVVPLPAETTLVPGSLDGPWSYDTERHALQWAGALAPGASLTLHAQLDVTPNVTDGAVLPLQAQLYTGDGLTVTDEAPVQIDVPWPIITKAGDPKELELKDTAWYTITVRNVGAISSTAQFTDTLPTGLALLAKTLSASQGTVTHHNNQVRWQGTVPAGGAVKITYAAAVTLTQAGALLQNEVELVEAGGRRQVAWTTLHVPASFYFPLIWKGSE